MGWDDAAEPENTEPAPDLEEEEDTLSHDAWLCGVIARRCEEQGLVPKTDEFSFEWHQEFDQAFATATEAQAEGPAGTDRGDAGGDSGNGLGGGFGGDFGF